MEIINQFISLCEFDYPLLTEEFNERNFGKINGILNNELKTLYNISYKPSKDKFLHQTTYFLMSNYGDRNYYVNKAPAELWAELSPTSLNIDEYDYFNVLTKFKTGVYEPEYHENEIQYMNTIAYYKKHMLLQPYTKISTLEKKLSSQYFTNQNVRFIEKVMIDKSLLRYLKNPIGNMKELKIKLKYDEDTHFYTYKGIGYICLHEMMRYEGKSIKEVFNLCANSKMRCKYCGAEIVYNTQQDEMELTAVQYSLIYEFVISLKLDNNENYLVSSIIRIIINNIQTFHLNEKVDGYVSLFLYKLYKQVNPKTKKSSFLDFCETIWQNNLWTKEQIEYSIKDDKRYPGLKDLYELILEIKNVEKNKDTNTLPYILLGPKLDENKTPIQKLYLKAPLELGELTKMIMMDIYNYTFLIDYETIEKTNEKNSFEKRTIQIINEKSNKQKNINQNITFTQEHNKHKENVISEIKKQNEKYPSIKLDLDLLLSDSKINDVYTVLQNIINIGSLNDIFPINKTNVIKMINYIYSLNKDVLINELTYLLIPKIMII